MERKDHVSQLSLVWIEELPREEPPEPFLKQRENEAVDYQRWDKENLLLFNGNLYEIGAAVRSKVVGPEHGEEHQVEIHESSIGLMWNVMQFVVQEERELDIKSVHDNRREENEREDYVQCQRCKEVISALLHDEYPSAGRQKGYLK